MILGHITGKVTPAFFSFKLAKEAKKLEYVQVYHKVYDFVLCQIIDIETTAVESIAKCKTIGYKDQTGKVRQIRIPFDVGVEVLRAEDDFIKKIISLEDKEKGAYIGKLEGRDIQLYLDINKLLTKHCAILAKSGAGKSYTVGVLIEEILDRKIPLLVIDPHGEYSKMRYENIKDKDLLAKYGLKPKGYELREYGDSKINEGVIPLKLTKNITNSELVHLMPAKLSSTQLGILYNALKNISSLNFNELLLELERDESSAKWSIISVIEYLNNLNIFSDSPVSYNQLVSPNNCSVINLKGIPPDIQEIIVYKLCKDLFDLRKENKIPPFFLVLEEAHNFCPERSFGEAKSSKILRTIASEGRKFGLGLCVVSQRPARVDKSVVSQCTTQMILKVTNPNDLKAISNSVEGITADSELEIQNLTIGTALVSGVVEIPLFVNIRPRKSMHGGDAVNILEEDEPDVIQEVKTFEKRDLLPVVKPRTTLKDIKLMSDDDVDVRVKLIPAAIISCKDSLGNFCVLVDLIDGDVIVDKEKFLVKKLPDINNLSKQEVGVLKKAFAKLSLSDAESKSLVSKGYLNADKTLSEDYIFSKLRNHATYNNLEYVSMSYDDKLEPVLSEETIRQKLSKVTTVVDFKDCFVVKYDVQ
ncbi:MAG: ATP-binding protein [Nanoarchaeota archaeon]|nr:ATP-binding protein [Nanoarchaeota archaeon]MBU1269423.1 ATP-binding protein [Nanoarchaeota archaeon]MBU1603702.1 ATP-binding protein [Nanoarchaeota archaeon]MBU2442939.1 ATP-binding protein [Nanoarchaeota archaeon]